MKKISLYTWLFLTSCLSSCEKFLDLKPTNALLSENAIYDAKTSRAVVNAAYSNLKNYYIQYDLVLGLLPGDNIFFGGSQSQNIELDNHAFTVTNSAIVGAYQANYSLINLVNWAISEIPKVEDPQLSVTEKNKLLGEAHFIRALAYFHLVRSWGGVQLQLQPTRDLNSLGDISRSTASETFNQIFKDLKHAEDFLPNDDATTRNRIQKSLVYGIRAKVNLYAGNYDQVEEDANKVIENPKYKLVTSYSDFFQEPFLSSESVFELSATTNNTGVSASPWLPSTGTPRGSYEFRPTQAFIDLINNPEVGGTRSALLGKRGEDYYGKLYHTINPSLNSIYVLRLADLYLIRAEARILAPNQNISGALGDLNLIRQRAQISPLPEFLTAAEILDAVHHERRLEFALEGDRWYDLVRTQKAGEVLGVQPNFWLFPIPQVDVLGDPSLKNVWLHSINIGEQTLALSQNGRWRHVDYKKS